MPPWMRTMPIRFPSRPNGNNGSDFIEIPREWSSDALPGGVFNAATHAREKHRKALASKKASQQKTGPHD